MLRYARAAWEPKLVPFASVGLTLNTLAITEFDLQIEHFPGCLAGESKLLPLLDVGRMLLASAQRYPARYIPHAKQKSQPIKTNFAQHQLETTEWLPHRKSLLYRG